MRLIRTLRRFRHHVTRQRLRKLLQEGTCSPENFRKVFSFGAPCVTASTRYRSADKAAFPRLADSPENLFGGRRRDLLC